LKIPLGQREFKCNWHTDDKKRYSKQFYYTARCVSFESNVINLRLPISALQLLEWADDCSGTDPLTTRKTWVIQGDRVKCL